MDKLFLSVLNMSLTGAFVIAAIIPARIPLKKAPKIISYCLWAIAGFRLVLPFSFESVLSLLPFRSTPVPADIGMQAVPRIDSGIPIVNNTISSMLPAATPLASVNPMQIWIAVGSYIWMAGLAVMLIHSVTSIVLLKRRLRRATLVRDNIYETGNLKTPFVIGLFRPKVYVPTGLAGEELRYVLLHEQIHIKRYDHIIKIFAYFVLCLHWFNPLAWAAFLLMSTDMEMSCDERVMKELGENIRDEYSMSLVHVATNRLIPNGSPLAFSEGGIRGRVKRILNFKKPSRIITAAAIALVTVLAICLATNKIGIPNEPPKITVKSGSSEIFYVVGKNKWNDAVYDREDNFIAQRERIFNRDMPYIKNGARITISFDGNRPDSIILSEIILDEHGNAKWRTDEHVKTYEVNFAPFGRTGTFTIEPNYATALSSDSTDYDAGNTIKGYKMVCSWGKNECEYAFVILGDAATMPIEPAETVVPYISPVNTVPPDVLNRLYLDMPRPDILNRLYLGMPRSEVESVLGKRDGEGSGLDFWIYNDVGSIYFSGNFYKDSAMYNHDEAVVTQIKMKDRLWDIYDLVSTAVKQHNTSNVPTGEYPTESHINLALDATANGFTVYVISLYETFLPDGRYNVSNIRSSHKPLALTFTKNANSNYELTEYWQPRDESEYLPSARTKFPKETWNKLDTRLYLERQKEICEDDAMYFFVGAIRSTGRYGLNSGTVVVTDRANDTIENECFVIEYFPGARIQIDRNELHEAGEYYIIRYTDPSKNIVIGKKSMDVPITDDLIGIFNIKTNEYAIKFKLYMGAGRNG